MSQGVDEAVERVLHEMVWDAEFASAVYRTLPIQTLTASAGAAALVFDHDRTHPDAPSSGPERALSISEAVHAHAIVLSALKREAREWQYSGKRGPAPANPYVDPVPRMDPEARGWDDRLLLSQAARLIRDGILVRIIAPETKPGGRDTALDALHLLRGTAARNEREAATTRERQLALAARAEARDQSRDLHREQIWPSLENQIRSRLDVQR